MTNKFVKALVLLVVVTLFIPSAIAIAGKGNDKGGPPSWAKKDKAEEVTVQKTRTIQAEEAEMPEGTETPEDGVAVEDGSAIEDPYALTQEMITKIEEIKATKPGVGNAWGRIAKELHESGAFTKEPGSTAMLVARIKEHAGADTDDQTTDGSEPVEEDQQAVQVSVYNYDPETNVLTVTFAGETSEPYDIVVDVEGSWSTGDILEVYVSAEGTLSLSPVVVEEPVDEEPTVEEPAVEEPAAE